MQERRIDEALIERPWRQWAMVVSIATVVVVIDQVTKSLMDRDDRIISFGPVTLARTYNHGVAFGLGSGIAPFLIPLAILGMLAALFYGRQVVLTKPVFVGVGLMLGGAVGNLIDRVFRDHGGAVVDFIDIGPWPVFNVADIGVTMGAMVLIIFGFFKDSRTK